MPVNRCAGGSGECVLKQTVQILEVASVGQPICFNTLPFFYPHKDKPSGRPPVYWMFQVPSEVLVTSFHTLQY